MLVSLTRDGATSRVRLMALFDSSAENIFLEPNDLLFLIRQPQSVVLLGANMKNAQIPFNQANLSLAETLGNGNGLADPLADPSGIFVFRYEPPATVKALVPGASPTAAWTPVVYRVNLKQGSGFFLAQNFPMRDKDVVYVATTPTVQLGKLIILLRDFSFAIQRNTIISN
jgi:polysaccharide export outer membrane protein